MLSALMRAPFPVVPVVGCRTPDQVASSFAAVELDLDAGRGRPAARRPVARSRRRIVMMPIGVIADDYTGASDIANTLAKGGLATVQLLGICGSASKVGPTHHTYPTV